MNIAGAERCPTRPVLTAAPETVDAWLEVEPPTDDEQAHHAWVAAHPFTVEFRTPAD